MISQPKQMTFIQPRHNYAPESGDGHIHLSAPLITIMSRIRNAIGGEMIEMTYLDENFEGERGKIESDIVGVNLVGAPYIPEAINIIKRVRAGATILLGGQIINSVDEDFDRLFKGVRNNVTVLNGNQEQILKETLDISNIPRQEDVSSIPVWKNIDKEQMKKYLSHEMSFYLSQGCKFNCHFCQAIKGGPEIYRKTDIAAEDLEWLTEKAISFGIYELSIYFSNLDIFQSPFALQKFIDRILEIKRKHDFTYKLRALAVVESTLEVDEKILNKFKEAGLVSIGVGADGATAAAWKQSNKKQNIPKNKKEAEIKMITDSIERLHNFDIRPEILMVFGHILKTKGKFDLDKSLRDVKAAEKFIKDMVDKFAAVPRPHIVKTLVPGSKEWKKRETNEDLRESFLDNPELFQTTDYTAGPSECSHPSPEISNEIEQADMKVFRLAVESAYRRICDLCPSESTQYIYPYTSSVRKKLARQGTTPEKENEGVYDR